MANQQLAAFPGQAQVIPAGFRWSEEDARRQRAKGSFLRVGAVHSTATGKNANSKPVRQLSGAVRKSWSSADPEEYNTIFNIQYRITGTPDSVRLALQYAGVPVQEVERAIADSITGQNYLTTRAREYQQEIQAHQARGREAPRQPSYDIPTLIYLAENIKSAEFVSNRGAQAGAAGGRAVGQGGGNRKSLAAAYQAVATDGQGKVLDVTNIDDVTGAGHKRKNQPRTAQGGVGAGNIPIVTKDPAKYVRALELLFGADARQTYANEIEQVRRTLEVVPVRGQPARFPAAQPQLGFPPLRPGAAMAAAPMLQTVGAPVPAVASPVRTLGGGAPGMMSFQQLRQ
jgi:hypothetical protein